MSEPNACRGVTPQGVKLEGSGNNAVGTLRRDAPVFHPKASREETERVPEGRVGTPAGVKTEGREALADPPAPVTEHDEEEEGPTDGAHEAASTASARSHGGALPLRNSWRV